MWLLMLINAAWCEVYFLFDSHEAGQVYLECLSAASGENARSDCFFGFMEALGNATLDWFACMN